MSDRIEYHISNIHERLIAQGKKQEDGSYLWEGSIMQLFDSCKISRALYTKIMRILEDSGTIVKLQRGYKDRPTRLRVAPAVDMIEVVGIRRDLTAANKAAMVVLDQRVKAIERQLGGIDIGQVINDLHTRISKLESAGRET